MLWSALCFFIKGVFLLNGTIAAIATGQDPGGIGTIRISGSDAISVADKVFSCVSGRKLSSLEGYRAAYGKVTGSDSFCDEAVALVFRAPHSYTGEDVVEISCHGGRYSTAMTLKACINAGARPAEAGEFTKRAFENGKMSLTQAESVMNIVSAAGRQSAAAAMAARDGKLAKRIEDIRKILTEIDAALAAWSDFPDDDVPVVTDEELVSKLRSARDRLSEVVEEGRKATLINEGINTVICGRPNVGKSTLMNLLSGKEKSIVTDIPGTTRDTVDEAVNIDGCVLLLSDTAGIRETNDKVETIGVQRALKSIDNAQLILAIFDASQPLDKDDISLIDSICDKPVIAIINKVDKEKNINEEYIKNKIKHIVYISAKNEVGIDQLRQEIFSVTELEKLDASSGIIINERQLFCASNALDCVNMALDDLAANMTYDAINVSIDNAIESLLELSGERVSDVVVDEIFSKFCIGK
ncbi:MAG: tRNA uridine-5-carboxymethylaminomethyl(34) synthesis GTPase MnmE [Clostridia bacterium]|nr:tRNA uridine-5-carboxymethylaminomethyl(34) synthesis GTPase MnmE [Clostridia bacterium]